MPERPPDLTLAEVAEMRRKPRGPSHFRQRDLEAALKALKTAGQAIDRIEIGSAGITIIPSRSDGQPKGAEPNEWDEGQ